LAATLRAREILTQKIRSWSSKVLDHLRNHQKVRMKTVEEYLNHAKKSEELAEMTDNPIHKGKIAEISEMWRELAEQRRRFIEGEKAAK
jgi:hypothetical protein